MLTVYDFDRNNIFVEPLKNRKQGTTKTACSLINDTQSNGGVIPKTYLLDNEESLKLKASTKKYKVSVSHSTHLPHKLC